MKEIVAALTLLWAQPFEGKWLHQEDMLSIKPNIAVPHELSISRTHNQFGDIYLEPDLAGRYFLMDLNNKVALEIGSGYGYVAREALTKGAKYYYLMDMEQEHLSISAVKLKHLPKQNWEFCKGTFPYTCKLPDASVDMVLMSKVIHFTTPKMAKDMVAELTRITKPGGKIHISSLSINSPLFENFIPKYRKNLEQGKEFPGYMPSLIPFISSYAIVHYFSLLKPYYHGKLNLFDKDALASIFAESFHIESTIEANYGLTTLVATRKHF